LERVDDLAKPAAEATLQERAELIFEKRCRRDECFPADLLREPAWDVLMLFIARNQGREVRQTDLLRSAKVPDTTGLRLLDQLEQAGLGQRRGGDGWKRKGAGNLMDAGQRMIRVLRRLSSGLPCYP